MVPTSTSRAPDCWSTSGTRKPPPISTLSPRLTTTSRPAASAASDEQHGGGVVVDHDRRLGAAQPGQQPADVVVPRAPVAGVEVELEVPVAGRLPVAEGRPPEVGVEQDAGGVDHRAQQRPLELAGAARGPTRDRRPRSRPGPRRRAAGGAGPCRPGSGPGRRPRAGASPTILPEIACGRSLGTVGDFAVARDRESPNGWFAVMLRRRWVSASGLERRNDARRSGRRGSGTASGRR